MTDTRTDQLNKKDFEVFLEVNRKAIEIETEVVGQNEEIISSLNNQKEQQSIIDNKLDEITTKIEKLDKDIFKIQVLFVTGALSLLLEIIQIFIKK